MSRPPISRILRGLSPVRIAGCTAVLTGLASPAPADPRAAIVSGDMGAVIHEIEALYHAHGLSWADWIEWKVGPYTTHYWYYDDDAHEIIAGAIPKPGEVADYWLNWSRMLTDGYFDPDGFFRSAQEALELARFNQWVLATHESAHAITFRYDPGHLARHGHDINCREYHADRLTAAILQDEARRDPEMAHWRERYLDLVTAMGASIPEEYTVIAADYAALEADCSVMAIEQPTPDGMQAYASAYFARYRALLEAELPPLDAVFATHLTDRIAQVSGRFPTLDGWAGGTVKTLRRHAKIHDSYIFPATHLADGWAYRASAFGPDGRTYIAEADYDIDRDVMTVGYGPADRPIEIVAKDIAWPSDAFAAKITSIAVLGPGEFSAAFEVDGESAKVMRFRRSDDGWRRDVVAETDEYGRAYVFRSAGDDLLIGYSLARAKAPDGPDKTWRLALLDGESLLETRSTTIPVPADSPVGADVAGRLYFANRHMVFAVDGDGNIFRQAGSGLEGNRDGTIETAQFSDVELLQFTREGDVLILDTAADDPDVQYTRTITPVP